MNIKDIVKTNGLKKIGDVLPKEAHENILKRIEAIKEPLTDDFINVREDYANSKYFMYYELKYIDKNKILLEYGKLKIEMPWQCIQDLELFKFVVDELAIFLKTNLKDSDLPKPDYT